jgi:hypothetical protein
MIGVAHPYRTAAVAAGVLDAGGKAARGAEAGVPQADPHQIGPLVGRSPGAAKMLASGRPVSVLAFTIRDGQVVEIDVLADPSRLPRLDLATLGDSRSS